VLLTPAFSGEVREVWLEFGGDDGEFGSLEQPGNIMKARLPTSRNRPFILQVGEGTAPIPLE